MLWFKLNYISKGAPVITLKPEWNSRHFAEGVFKAFVLWKVWYIVLVLFTTPQYIFRSWLGADQTTLVSILEKILYSQWHFYVFIFSKNGPENMAWYQGVQQYGLYWVWSRSPWHAGNKVHLFIMYSGDIAPAPRHVISPTPRLFFQEVTKQLCISVPL